MEQPICVYTAIIGGYDDPPTIAAAPAGVRFMLVTDSVDADAAAALGWEVRDVPVSFADTKMTSGYVKTHPQLFVDDGCIAVWVDANLRDLRIDAAQIRRDIAVSPVVALPHPERTTVAAEGAEVVALGLDTEERVAPLLARLRDAGFPDDGGLTLTLWMARNLADPRVGEFDTTWWQHIENGSRRDQLGVDAALWQAGIVPLRLDIRYWTANPLFRYTAHARPSGRRVAEPGPSTAADAADEMAAMKQKLAAKHMAHARLSVDHNRLLSQYALLRREASALRQARSDLAWVVRRLDRIPLGWALRRVKGFRVLRDRYL